MHHLATLLVVSLIWISPVFPGCLDEVGSLPVGPASVVEAVESVAFVGNGPRLTLVDISLAGEPIMISEVVFPDLVTAIEPAGDVVFVASSGSGLWIVDISDPNRPSQRAIFATQNYSAIDLEINEDILYLAESRYTPNGPQSSLRIIDVQDPVQPIELGTLDRSAAFSNMVLSEGRLFITDGWRDSLVILDVTDSHNPLFLAEHRLYSHPGRIAVSGEHVFVPTSGGSVYSVDISNPASPWTAASLGGLENYLNCIEIFDGLAYVTTWRGRIELIDVSDPSSLSHIGTITVKGSPRDISLSGERLFVASGGEGMLEFNITDPEQPVQIGVFDTPGELLDVAVSGNFVYTAEWESAIRVFDVTDPSLPVVVTQSQPLPEGWKIKSFGNSLFLATNDSLLIFDISEPASPTLTGEIEESLVDFTLDGETVFLLTFHKRIIAVDISDPDHPVEIGRSDVQGGDVSRIEVQDGHAFIADPGCIWFPCYPQLITMNIDDPADASVVSTINIDFHDGFDVSGSYAYSTTGYELSIVDISNPEEPSLKSTLEFKEPKPGVAVHYRLGYAYVTTYDSVIAINVRNPSNPIRRATVEFNSRARNAVPAGGLLYVANGPSGLKILEDCSEQPREIPQESTTE